jgi:hypothetical protein
VLTRVRAGIHKGGRAIRGGIVSVPAATLRKFVPSARS